MAKQNGLEWVGGMHDLQPRWTVEPSIEKIEMLARKHLEIKPNVSCQVTFYAQGGFNKLYKIETEAGSSLMRVALPVDPSKKTNSEVATIRFVAQNTDIPVPQIFGFDDSVENELGFEWILMEMLPGAALRTRWRKLSEDAKRQLVKQVAKYQAQLFGHKFSAIGNMFIQVGTQLVQSESPRPSDTSDIRQEREGNQQSSLEIGPLVSLAFFWGDHSTQVVPRGPFANSKDWLRAHLTFVLTDQEKILHMSNDENEIEDAEELKALANRLLKLLPSVFPSDTHSTELSTLFHDDLSLQNILVDKDGNITGLVDWECVSALPLWRACQIPEFLRGGDRTEKPERNIYGPYVEDEEDAVEDSYRPSESVLDNEGMNNIYWDHLLEYELTMFRELFLKEMGTLAPGWVELAEKWAFQADFEEAVQRCHSCWSTKMIKSWLDGLEEGEKWSLRSRLHR